MFYFAIAHFLYEYKRIYNISKTIVARLLFVKSWDQFSYTTYTTVFNAWLSHEWLQFVSIFKLHDQRKFNEFNVTQICRYTELWNDFLCRYVHVHV